MLTCQRDAFQLPPDQHYLNCAYMSPLLRAVEEAGIAGIRRKRNPSDITPEDFFDGVNRVRGRFARLIGAGDPQRIAVVPSASFGLTTAARNLPLRAGQTVVVAAGQMPSNVYCWRRVTREAGATMRTVEPPPPGSGGCYTDAILEAIDDGTAVVALGTVHWFDGRRLDLDRIARRTQEAGAALVLDGTQSVGAVPLDVDRLRPAAVVVACYKWLLGPYSVALAWFGPELDDGVPLDETWLARPGSEDFGRLADYREAFRPGAARYDVGETSNFVLMPMVEAGLRQLEDWTVPRVSAYCERLTATIAEAAARLGYAVDDPGERSPHIIGVRLVRAGQGERLREALRRRGVAVSVRGDAVRISPHLYNDEGDVTALVSALDEVSVASG